MRNSPVRSHSRIPVYSKRWWIMRGSMIKRNILLRYHMIYGMPQIYRIGALRRNFWKRNRKSATKQKRSGLQGKGTRLSLYLGHLKALVVQNYQVREQRPMLSVGLVKFKASILQRILPLWIESTVGRLSPTCCWYNPETKCEFHKVSEAVSKHAAYVHENTMIHDGLGIDHQWHSTITKMSERKELTLASSLFAGI